MTECTFIEFINLRKVGMNVLVYSMKFSQLSKYTPSLDSHPSNEMSHFVIGVSDDLQEECHSAMLHDNMKISRLMLHARQVEEERPRWKSKDAKKERSLEGGSPRIVLNSKQA